MIAVKLAEPRSLSADPFENLTPFLDLERNVLPLLQPILYVSCHDCCYTLLDFNSNSSLWSHLLLPSDSPFNLVCFNFIHHIHITYITIHIGNTKSCVPYYGKKITRT